MADLVLEVNGQRYGGWESGSVTLDMEAIAGSFDLNVSERWANRNTNWPIHVEDQCKISIGGKTVITGAVSKRRASFSDGGAGISVGGRDRSGALVDCSAFIGAWQFANIALDALVKKLCAPFGIDVKLQPQLIGRVPILRQVSISPGETAFNVLERACRQAGVLAVSDGDGEITLTRVDDTPPTAALVQGQNIKEAEINEDVAGRYAKYRIVTQQIPWEELGGAGVCHVSGEATDTGVKDQTRILLLHAEDALSPAQAKIRAQWEATVRAARSQSVSVTVPTWTQPNGDPWSVNTLVRIDAPRLRIRGSMLITQAKFNLQGGQGTTAQLQLKRPDAFTPEPNGVKSGLWNEIKGGV
jgi:prophage tail gpP-like protein